MTYVYFKPDDDDVILFECEAENLAAADAILLMETGIDASKERTTVTARD